MNVRVTIIREDNTIYDYFANLTEEDIDNLLSRSYFSARGAQKFKAKLLRAVPRRCDYKVGGYQCAQRWGHDVKTIPHSLDEL